MAADSTSVNLYKALNAALRLAGPRKTILSDSGNFPTDLYIAEGVIGTLDRGYQLKVVAPEEVAEAMDETVAVLMLTEVDYRTGRLHDMAALTAKAKALGIVTIWDLAHSAGALPVDAPAELATGRYGPLASLIVVSLLSLGIWAAIWALLGSLLWG